MPGASRPLEVFYSYSHRDERLRDRLEEHLSILKNNGVIIGWHDRDINAGTKWEQEIDEHLNSADIILLLVSASFLASRYCYSIEMKRALERHDAGEATVIPIILRPVDWKGAPFGKLQVLPTDGKPVTQWPDRETAFTNIAQGIRRVAEEIRQKTATSRSTPHDPIRVPRLSRVWTVPHPRNPNFTGREELLKELREKLTSGQPTALTQAISGLGGVGKTQLASEYAYRYASDYDAVLWVRAEEPTTLAADFAGLTNKIGISSLDSRDQNEVIQVVQRWLTENDRWLLVFDNAPGGWQISGYLPPIVTGHVLITSRNRHWRDYAEPLVVDVMTEDEAIKFLLKRTGQADEAAAGTLADELGYLPLALAQAGAYIDQKEISLAEYLALLHKHGIKVLPPTANYPGTLAATWDLSFQAVREHLPEAADLLNLCAFFAPEDIPLDMVVEGAEHLPGGLKNAMSDALILNDIVGELGNYSLVEVDKERRAISIHRLVQVVVQDKLSSEERQMWVEASLRVVTSSFSYQQDDVSTWPIAAVVLPHALAVISSREMQEHGSTDIGILLSYLLTNVGLYFQQSAQYKEARLQFERALAIDEAVYGPDDPNVAADLLHLGGVFDDLRDLEAARTNYERALAIYEAVYGPDHPSVATALNNLGSVFLLLQDLEAARTNYERALAIYEAVYGPDHKHVAIGLNNLAGVLQDLGELEAARSNYERALAIGETAYGPDHPAIALRLNNLAGLLRDLGELEAARSNYERALAINETAYGPDHPRVAITLNNLATLFVRQGNFQQAQVYFRRAHTIFLKHFGPEHYYTVSTNYLI